MNLPGTGASPDLSQAGPPVSPSGSTAQGAVVAVRLGAAWFGLPIEEVREVLRTPSLARVPYPPGALCGALGLRGTVLPVLDLGLRLGRQPAERPGRIVVVQARAAAEPVGLLVDAVGGVASPSEIERRTPPPEAEVSLPSGWVEGIVLEQDRLLTVLALQPVLGRGAARSTEQTADSDRGEANG